MQICRLRGKSVFEIACRLEHVNEKGIDGIWECRPFCGANQSLADRLVDAIEGEDESRKQTVEKKGS